MAPLTGSRPLTDRLGDEAVPDLLRLKVAAGASCFQGGMAMLNSDGFVLPAEDGDALAVVVGRFERSYDNTDGDDGDLTAEVRQGVFKWANDTAAVEQEHVGSFCYAVDDQTVSDDGTGNRPVAGIVVQLEDDGGVYVQSGMAFAAMLRFLD